MNRNTLKIILASTLLSSASYADISNITPASTTSLSQIASSLSHSVSNVDNNINVETTTSNIINTADLKKILKQMQKNLIYKLMLMQQKYYKHFQVAKALVK